MNLDLWKLYDDSLDFFRLSGNAVMKLTSKASQEVCIAATSHHLTIVRIEGGFHGNKGFESRRDCIWDGLDTPISQKNAQENNIRAENFIREHSNIHNAFVVTVAPISG